jgi:hypothetical protein
MNPALLRCDGFTDGSLTLPPWELRRGQAICLRLPNDACGEFDARLYDLLTGRSRMPGLDLTGRVSWIAGTWWQPGRVPWWHFQEANWWPSPRIETWLQRNGGMTSQEAAAARLRLGLKVNWRMNRLSGNDKMLLGLEATFAAGADAIVIPLQGVDPLGQEAAVTTASARLDQQAAIFLTYPYWHQWQLHPAPCVAGVPCFNLEMTGAGLKTSA